MTLSPLLSILIDQCDTSNECLILLFLYDHESASRVMIVNRTGLKRSFVQDALVELHAKKMIKREIIQQNQGKLVVHWSIKRLNINLFSSRCS